MWRTETIEMEKKKEEKGQSAGGATRSTPSPFKLCSLGGRYH
jgi:hypothetical protein